MKTKKQSSYSLYTLLGLSLAGQAHAQALPADAKEATLPTVSVRADASDENAKGYVAKRSTTATKIDAPVKDIPQDIVVVTGELLRDRGVTKVNEVADTVSGVVRQSTYGGNNASAGFIVRGFPALKLRDGMRLTTQNFGDAFDIATIERVEVLKGPASVLYGASEPGGTINFVTRKPYARFGGEVTVSYDSFGTGRLAADLNTPVTSDNSLLFRLNAAHEGGDTYRDFVNRDTTLVAPTLQWSPSKTTLVTLQYEWVDASGLFDRGLGQPSSYVGTGIDYQSLPVERFIGEPSVGRSRTETSHGILTIDQELAHDWNLKLAYSQNYFEWRSQPEIGLDSFDPATGLFNRYFLDYPSQGERTRHALAEIFGKIMLGQTEHKLLFGADITRNKAYYIAVAGDPPPSPIDLFNPQYNGYSGYTTSFSYSGLQGSDGSSFYVQDLIAFTPQWKALAAVRYDRSDRFSGAYPGQPDDTGEVNRSSFSRTSPRAGVVYQPTAADSFYGSLSTSFAPSQFINLRDPSNFKPETGKQFELGWKRDWADGRLSSTLAAFDIRKRNVAVSDPTNQPDEFFEVQVGAYRSRGVEFDIAGSPWPGLQASAGIGYIEADVDESDDPNLPVGARMPNVPRVTANLWVNQKLAEAWTIGAGLFHASSAPVSIPDNGLSVPAYTRFDAALTWHQGPWRVQLTGKNLTDVKYYAASNTIMPQAPRHAVLSASYQF